MESKQTLFLVIALIVIAGGAYWFLQYGQNMTPNTEIETATSTQEVTTVPKNTGPAASLSVEADKASYAVGDQVALTFYVDTPVPVDGADVVFTFDSTNLELVAGLAKGNFSQQAAQIAQVNLAQKTTGLPVIQYASTTKMGNQIKYTFSALALPGEGITGKTKLGVIKLRAKKTGDTPVTISFEKAGVSTDSNVAYEGRDILKTVEGTTVRVEAKKP